MSSTYIKLNGISFDANVAISKYTRNFNVLDGENSGRVMTGRMERDIIGAYLGNKITFFRKGDNYQGYDALWDYLVQHSVDKDGVWLEVADGQQTLAYQAYYSAGEQQIEQVLNGINYWGEMEINFIPMDAQVRPS